MKVKTLIKLLRKADPDTEVRIAEHHLSSGIDHAFKVQSARMGAMTDTEDIDGIVVCRSDKRGAKKVMLIRERTED